MSSQEFIRSRLAKQMAGIGAALALAYFGILFLTVLFENKLIYFPNVPGRLDGDWSPKELPIEDVTFETEDGVKLNAWWIPAEHAEFTFLAFHGNAANIVNRAEVYRFLHALPVNVLAVEYRGYGKSQGTPREVGLYLDAEAAYEYVRREHGIAGQKIVAFGQSLGTAVATDLASRRELGGLVLEAPFVSARAMAQRFYWFLPGLPFVLRTKFETGRKLQTVSAPVLVVHCAEDPVIPFALGEEVFRVARPPKQFYRVEGYCHEEATLVDPGGYRTTLLEFLETARKSGRAADR